LPRAQEDVFGKMPQAALEMDQEVGGSTEEKEEAGIEQDTPA